MIASFKTWATMVIPSLGLIIRRMTITLKKDSTDFVPAPRGFLDFLESLTIIYLALALTTIPFFWFLVLIMTLEMTPEALPLSNDLSTFGYMIDRAPPS
jgi:hypothetical protein